jgi:hypothetical protein
MIALSAVLVYAACACALALVLGAFIKRGAEDP